MKSASHGSEGRGGYRLALGLAALSGAAGLGHQLLWTRRLVDLLGASAESATRVFGCFFLGLSIGAALGAWGVTRFRNHWRSVGIVEFLVAALTIPILFLPQWTDWLWPAMGAEALAGWQGGLAKFALSMATVTPPAAAMGVVLPALAAASLPTEDQLGSRGVRLYAANTLGGVAGLLFVVQGALPRLGAFGSMLAVACLNVAVGAAALARSRSASRADKAPPARASAGRRPWFRGREAVFSTPRAKWALGVAFVSGFLILGFESLALRMIMLVASISFFCSGDPSRLRDPGARAGGPRRRRFFSRAKGSRRRLSHGSPRRPRRRSRSLR